MLKHIAWGRKGKGGREGGHVHIAYLLPIRSRLSRLSLYTRQTLWSWWSIASKFSLLTFVSSWTLASWRTIVTVNSIVTTGTGWTPWSGIS